MLFTRQLLRLLCCHRVISRLDTIFGAFFISKLEAVPTFKENQCEFHIQVERSTRLSQTCNSKLIIVITKIDAGTASSPDVASLHRLSHQLRL
jgi:hypothetical protein